MQAASAFRAAAELNKCNLHALFERTNLFVYLEVFICLLVCFVCLEDALCGHVPYSLTTVDDDDDH